MSNVTENTLDTRLAVTLLDYLYKNHATNDEVMIDKQTGKLYYKKPDGVIIPCSSDSDNTAISNIRSDISSELAKNLDFSEIDMANAGSSNMMSYSVSENVSVFDDRAFVAPIELTELIDTKVPLSSVAIGMNIKLRPDDYRLINIWKNIHLDKAQYKMEEDKYDYNLTADINGTEMKMNGNFGEMSFFNIIPSYGIWSASGNMITGTSKMASTGLQDSAISIAGIESLNPVSNVYKFDGINWKSGINTPVSIFDAVAIGIPNNNILVGGTTLTKPLSTGYKFNGEVWATIEDTNTKRSQLSGCGTVSSAIILGGQNEVSNINTTERYDGTTWSNGINMNIIKKDAEAVGRADSLVSIGGVDSVVLPNAEKFNGIVWYNTDNMNIARNGFGASGERDNAIAYSGDIGATTEVLKSDIWFTGMNQLANRTQSGSSGNSTHALSFGGSNISLFSEKFTKENKLELDKTWSIYGMQVYNRLNGAGTGTQVASLAFGGKTGTSIHPESEKFNGSIWTVGPNTVSNRYENCGVGSYDSSISMGGLINDKITNSMEKFDGEIWSEYNTMNSNRKSFGACGTSSSFIVTGGIATGKLNTTEVYTSDTWTSKGNLLYTKSEHTMFGIYDNAIEVSGMSGANIVETCSIFNGLTWSAKNGLNSVAYDGSGIGTSTNGVFFGGNNATEYNNNTEKFNGTIWQVNPSQLNYLRHGLSASGKSDIGLSFGGDRNKGYTEKFDGYTWNNEWSFNDTSSPFKLKDVSINKWKTTVLPVEVLEKILPPDGEIKITDIDFTIHTKSISDMDLKYNPLTSIKLETIVNNTSNYNDNFIQIVTNMDDATGQVVFLKKGEISI